MAPRINKYLLGGWQFAAVAALVSMVAVCLPKTARADDDMGLDNYSSTPTKHPLGVSLAVGPLLSTRHLLLTGDTYAVKHDVSPYVGGQFDVGFDLWNIHSLGAILSLQGDAGWGEGKSQNYFIGIPNKPMSTLTYGSGRLVIERALGKSWDLNFGVGVQATSFTLTTNGLYSGQRYISSVIALGIGVWPWSRHLSVTLKMRAFPGIITNNSGGAYGQGSTFGARLGGQIAWWFKPQTRKSDTHGMALMFRYYFQRYRGQYPQAQLGSRGALSNDDQQFFSVMLAYAL